MQSWCSHFPPNTQMQRLPKDAKGKPRQLNEPKNDPNFFLIPDAKGGPIPLNILRFSEVHLSPANTTLGAQTALITLS